MIRLVADFNISEVAALLDALDMNEANSFFPNTNNALRATVQTVKNMWSGWAMGRGISGIPNIRRPSGELAQSIRSRQTGVMQYVVYTEHPEAERIAKGTPQTDMKDLNSPWLRSHKTRLKKRGGVEYPYLIIPFSWVTRGGTGVKNVVPPSIVSLLKEREMSMIIAQAQGNNKFEKNRYHEMIPRASYQWGGRIAPNESVMSNGYDSGMVRMWDSAFMKVDTGKYFTFRVLSPVAAPEKWIRKAVDPIDVPEAIKTVIEKPFIEAVEEGLRRDLEL